MDLKQEIEKDVAETKKFFHRMLDGLKTFGKHLGNLVLFAIAIVAGFCIGYYYSVFLDKTVHQSPMKSVKTVQTTSVAISERNELIIIDRASGNYTVFQDSVGMAIFHTYANRIYNQVQPAPQPQAKQETPVKTK